MSNVAVNSAVRKQSHQVKSSTVFDTGSHCVGKNLVFKESAVFNLAGYQRKDLVNDTTGSDICVPNLTVADLSLGEAHIKA